MKPFLLLCSFLLWASPVFGDPLVWPFSDVIRYECEQAMKHRKENGFGCKLQDETLQIGIFDFFEEDEERAKAARHQRLTLASKYVLAGGEHIAFADASKKPILIQTCNLKFIPFSEPGLKPVRKPRFICGDWRELRDSEK